MKLDTIKSLRKMAGMSAIDEEAYTKQQAELAEAALDDEFNVQMKKIQGSIDKLIDIVDKMTAEGSMTKPVASQKIMLQTAADDLKKLHDKV